MQAKFHIPAVLLLFTAALLRGYPKTRVGVTSYLCMC